jgi:hypothetical protein
MSDLEVLRYPASTREYVNGEGFLYLGRSYRLTLVDGQDVPLRLDHGRFKLLRGEAERGRSHFVRWYMEHARPWLHRSLNRFAGCVGVDPTAVEVRDLGHRWGSCGKRGMVNFHWATILLPPTVAEYVVVHELVHLHEPHHTPGFWRRIERAMPDYEGRKRWLAERGASFAAL